MEKNILFLVTGMTPQIITETLYALAADPDSSDTWVPDEVHVLTTVKGATQIRARLFNDGIFKRFITDYKLPNIKFDESTLHVITNNGEYLEDLRTLEDNEIAANEVCRLVKGFTQDSDSKLHVSIAGGRKTMGFYAGYALSLYGRAQDSMSHVLVSEEFEFATNFYYPTPYEYYVGRYNSQERLNAQEAKIYLADIPFVRLRNALSESHPLKMDSYKFSDVVEQINQSNQKINLVIDVTNQKILVNDKLEADIPPRELAMLMWFAEDKIRNGIGIKAPTGTNKGNNSAAEDVIISELTEQYLDHYDEIKTGETNIVVSKEFFDATKSKLKKCLEKQLGLELAAKLLPKQSGRSMPFYLPIIADQITIKNNFKDIVF